MLRACELSITQLERGDERDKVALESLWVSALSSHAQCFRPRGERRMGLSVTDRSETGLKGDVDKAHDLLGKLRGTSTSTARPTP
jgi:hypothetical protein